MMEIILGAILGFTLGFLIVGGLVFVLVRRFFK